MAHVRAGPLLFATNDPPPISIISVKISLEENHLISINTVFSNKETKW
jgi:hypothetical protein